MIGMRSVRGRTRRVTGSAAALSAVVAAALTGLVGACTWGSPGGMVVGSGEVTSETRSVSDFTEVEAGGGVQLQLTMGPQRVVVKAQPNIVDITTTEVSGSRLKVETTSGYVSTQGLVVEISLPKLTAVALSGGASVSGAAGSVDKLGLELSGGARADLTGTVTDLDLNASGGAIVELGDLRTTNAQVDLSGGVVATLDVTGRLAGSASGGVVITLKSQPGTQSLDTSGGAVVRGP